MISNPAIPKHGFVVALVLAFSWLVPSVSAEDYSEKFGRCWISFVSTATREVAEGEVDLDSFKSLDDLRRDTKTWVKVEEMLSSRQMLSRKSDQPTDEQRATLQQWVNGFLIEEARALAGDPGRVVLRRLNNDEYNYSVRDLTGVPTLNPTREFPVDGAAGEGFTNAGDALGMSPALVDKFLDAGKEARHLVLLPDGIRFFQIHDRA